MHRLQELVRLSRLGVGSRRIAIELKMGRNTVRTYRGALHDSGLLKGDPSELPQLEELKAAVEGYVPSRPARQQTSTVEQWRVIIDTLLSAGLGPQAIYDRLRLEHPEFKGSLAAVKRMTRRIRCERGVQPQEVAIPVDTAPGEIAQVDFGYVGRLWDARTGRQRKAWVFVLVLGYSRHLYAEVVFDQTVTTWMVLHERAFNALGGVPRVVVPDNLKAAVIRAAFGVTEIAGQRIHGSTGRRPLEVFQQQEQSKLLALPARPYEPVVWKEATVHADSHIEYERRLYSVPWRLLRQKVWVRATPDTVAVYWNDERVATHSRHGTGFRSTHEPHLPEGRRDLRHRSREYWQERAGRLGEEVGTFIEEVFDSDDVLSQLRTVQAIVTHLEKYPVERARAACQRASIYGITSYQGIKNILLKALDLAPLPTAAPTTVWVDRPRFARPMSELIGGGHERH